MTRRGTYIKFKDKSGTEVVCDCECHTRGGMHMVACCYTPKTAAGKALLEAYEVTHYAIQSNEG